MNINLFYYFFPLINRKMKQTDNFTERMDVHEGILKKQKDNKMVFQQSQHTDDSINVRKNQVMVKPNVMSPGGGNLRPQLNRVPSGLVQSEEILLESLLPYTKHSKEIYI